jgi:tetratricopeptide (TPR) repeat protein
MKDDFPSERIAILLIILAGLAVYSNTLDVPFYFDDLNNISQNPAIHLKELNPENLYKAAFKSHISTRPVANISLALNYYFHGLTPAGYHIVNGIIHLLCGIAVFYLIRATLTSPAYSPAVSRPALAALYCAMLWLIHPLHTQSVTYIIQRMNSLSSLLYLWALLLFIKGLSMAVGRRKFWLFAAALLFWVLAIGTKEIAVTLPFFAFLYYWYFYADLDRDFLRRGTIFLSISLALILLLALVYLGDSPLEKILAGFDGRDFTLGERLLTQPRVIVHYLSLIVVPLPHRLQLDYDFTLSTSLFSPASTLPAMLFVLGLLAVAIIIAPRYRLLSFSILWFLGNLALESSFLPLEIIYEHRTYLPMVFFFSVPSIYLASTQRVKNGAVLALALVLVLSYWSHQRNEVWRDPVVFWRQNIARASAKARPYSELGMVYANRGDIEQAISLFTRAVVVDANYAPAYNNLGIAMAMKGQLEKATDYFKKALERDSTDGSTYLNLGRLLLMRGQNHKAVSALLSATRLQPQNNKGFLYLGIAYLHIGEVEKAEKVLSTGLLNDPDNIEIVHYYRIAQEMAAQAGENQQ